MTERRPTATMSEAADVEPPASTQPAASAFVADLRSDRARQPAEAGAKAASLAIAASCGLPTIPGFAITTAVHDVYLAAGRAMVPQLIDELRSAWAELSAGGTHALVVRSSSTVEDTGSSSMAGQVHERARRSRLAGIRGCGEPGAVVG